MADKRLRDLQRRVAGGDPEAFGLLVQHIVRTTGLRASQVEARYYFPNLYEWCLAAIQHETIYNVQEWFPQTDQYPTRVYLKYWTIKDNYQGKPQLDQCCINSDRESPHYETLVGMLRWIEIDRHPWGQHFCFLGSGYEDKLEEIFRIFGLHRREGSIPRLTRLFSVHPNTYQEQFEEDPELGYDVTDDEDEDDEDEDDEDEDDEFLDPEDDESGPSGYYPEH